MSASGQPEVERLVGSDLRTLVTLQRLDDRVRSLEERRGRLPGEVAAARRALETCELALAEIKSVVTTTKKAADEKNMLAEGTETEVKKLDSQLFSLKSNEEFERMKKQIATRRQQQSDLQDKAIELMMSLDDLAARQKEREADVAAARAALDAAETRMREEEGRLEGQIASAKGERDKAAAALPPTILERYEAIRSRRDGVGVGMLDEETGMCSVCFTQVTMSVLGQVSAGRFICCPHCDRILYSSQSLQG